MRSETLNPVGTAPKPQHVRTRAGFGALPESQADTQVGSWPSLEPTPGTVILRSSCVIQSLTSSHAPPCRAEVNQTPSLT
jgi:hypothetical protein